MLIDPKLRGRHATVDEYESCPLERKRRGEKENKVIESQEEVEEKGRVREMWKGRQ